MYKKYKKMTEWLIEQSSDDEKLKHRELNQVCLECNSGLTERITEGEFKDLNL